jgi:hypothetical protein
MKLETGDDIKKAIAILDRERPNFRFYSSKLVTIALSDSNFTGAVKRRAPDQGSAEALIKELQADPKNALKLSGAESLQTRLQRSAEADAAMLRRVSQRLKEAAEKIKKASSGRAALRFAAADTFQFARVSFTTGGRPINPVKTVMVPDGGTVMVIIIAIAAIAYVVGYVSGRITNPDLVDDIAKCQENADAVLSGCESEANKLPAGFPFFLREAALALCYGEWLARQASCIVLG